MTLRSRMTGSAMVIALSVVGLSACGSDDSDSKKTDTASTDTASTDAGDEETSAAPEADGDKPAKKDVVEGYSKLVQKLAGGTELPDDILNKVVTCFVDEVYDDASPKTLNAIADSDQAGIDPADASLFTDATGTCQKAAM